MNPELLLSLFFLLLLLFYLIFLAKIKIGLKRVIKDQEKSGKNKHQKNKMENVSRVSVIIPFRNESANILNSLNCIEQQDYPEDAFEVIYVNDSSTDGSAELLERRIKCSNIRVINADNKNIQSGFKKAALKKGIEESHGEIIITTDADTLFGKKWLKSLVEKFDEQTGLVSGPVNLNYNKDIFSAFQVIEFAGLVLAGAGLIGIKNPVICNGANLAYRKKVYNEVNGFSDHLHLSSGEDELLMQSISRRTPYKISFSWNSESLVTTVPVHGRREFLQQRRRWASKSFYYTDKSLRLKLFLIFLFYLGIPVQLLSSLFHSNIFFLSFLLTLISKFILEYSIIRHGIDFLFPQRIMKYFLFAEIIQIPYIIFSAAAGALGNFTWKERKLRR